MTNLSQIQAALGPYLDQMNRLIADTLHCDTPLMNNIVASYLQVKGKQLRPIMAMLSGLYFGQVNDRVVAAAAAVEMLHNASLIHDDVIDEAQQRRGQDTINHTWSNHVAVLVGDYFVTTALRCAVMARDSRILEELAKMGGSLSLGEIAQVDNARRHNVDEATYMGIIGRKTAALFESCVAVGGLALDAPLDQIETLRRFAQLLGICFQMKDDTFDYYHDDVVGKPTGNDLREGKVTLPLIYAMRQTSHPDQPAMAQLLQQATLSTEQIEQLVDFAKRAGGIDYTYDTMKRLQREADDVLNTLPHSQAIDWMRDIFSYIIARDR